MKKPKAGIKMQVTSRAVVQRINRKLAPQMKKLCVTRGDRMRQEFGDFYIVDYSRNTVIDWHINPEALARDLDVLQPHEVMSNG
jgi:hypothetical protein